MTSALLVAVGAGCGAALRYVVAHLLDRPLVSHWGTFLVNLAGSLLLGWLLGAAVNRHAYALWGVGFCGALTTYSSVSVQAVNLRGLRGLGYAVGTVLASLGAAWLGLHVS